MNSTDFTYRLCNADDFDVWKDLNLAFMQEEIQDEDLWNSPDTEDVDTWKRTFEEVSARTLLSQALGFAPPFRTRKPTYFSASRLLF